MGKTLQAPEAAAAAVRDPLRSVEIVSAQTSLPKPTIYQLLDKGVIPAVRLPGTGTRAIIRVRQSAIDAYIASGN